MDTLFLLGLEIVLCLSVSIVLIVLLRPVLREVLRDTCGSQGRADFWVMFTQLMLIISPLLLVVYFAPTAQIVQLNVPRELKQTLFRVLLGDFIALGLVGRVIWRSIDLPPQRADLDAVGGAK